MRGGKVTASRTFPEVVNGASLRGTVSGPCLSYDEGGQGVTRCFAPDLKTEWAKLSGTPFIANTGKAAYTVLTDWNNPASANGAVERVPFISHGELKKFVVNVLMVVYVP